MKYVLLYRSADDVMTTAPIHYPAHRARALEFHERGTLQLMGTWADPRQGAMAVFTTREAAQEFVDGDPFVLGGVVVDWEIREWNEGLDRS